LLLARKQYPQAEPVLRRALAVREATVGPLAPEAADSHELLATLYMSEKNFEQAGQSYERELFILNKTLGTESPAARIALQHVAEAYGAQGKAAEAEPLYRSMLAVQENDTARNLRGLGVVLTTKGQFAEAEGLFKTAIALLDKHGWATARRVVYNPTDAAPPILIQTLVDYSALLKAEKKKGDANKMEARARILSGKDLDVGKSRKR
jgi:tetratricopeptide (TPR) repeat protein